MNEYSFIYQTLKTLSSRNSKSVIYLKLFYIKIIYINYEF
jgi:hypothetical protein